MVTPAEILHGSVLIVDDQDSCVLLLERMLRGAGYDCVSSTTNPVEVVDLHREHHYDLILLDLQMPVLDGFGVMEQLKELDPDGYLPVLVITAQPDHKLRALQSGAKDFISKLPFDRAEVLLRVANMLEIQLLNRELLGHNDLLQLAVFERTAELRASYLETVLTVSLAAEHRDTDTGSHLRRISCSCRTLAQALGLDDEFVEELYFASPMHDIGKIGVPDSVLLKPGSFTPAEWEIMKLHTVNGERILSSGTSPYLRMGAVIALNHHECWNGEGYPHGIKGDAIPFAARIVKICDIYDALRSERPYKLALGHDEAMGIIEYGNDRTSPDHFDPVVLAAFVENQASFRELFDEYPA
jgi:putative two-component system response regulator